MQVELSDSEVESLREAVQVAYDQAKGTLSDLAADDPAAIPNHEAYMNELIVIQRKLGDIIFG